MTLPLSHWNKLYHQFKHEALCLDIETTGWNKPISVIGLYRPSGGIPEVIQLIRGENLNKQNLTWAIQGCKLLITYNGIKFDLKRIRQEFPGVIPYRLPVLDLYRFSKRCGIKTDLKTLEATFQIERIDAFTKRRGIAVNLWRRYQAGEIAALSRLLEYNKQDTINLYPLAEELTQRAEAALAKRNQSISSNPKFPRIVE